MRPAQKFKFDKMTMGTCYYPEHWDESLWESDLDRMLSAGISVIRIAEFAWSKIEFKEDKFDFSFFDGFLKLCENKGMKVIMCTPTATPPAWLTEKYPEVLNKTIDGVTLRHGTRRHYTLSSDRYNELAARIVTKMARHYGKKKCIIGWQIDNEINCEVCEYYSEADDTAFRRFLKDRYRTLDALNEAWGTAFWNQQYTDWKEVHIPQPLLNHSLNPHRYLDYYRYISDAVRKFFAMQSAILRKYIAEEQFITTNGIFWNIDNHRMSDESLDIYMYDSYPNFPNCLDWDPGDKSVFKDRQWSRKLIETRSICPHFGIMEQQSGTGSWVSRMMSPAPKPGQLNLWALQSVAHGADYVGFFRWRTCSFGTEMYWHGILDYDNRDNRKLAEVKQFHDNMMKLQEVCGADTVSPMAVIRDYDNLWDTNCDTWHKLVNEPSERALFEAAQLTHTGMDYVYMDDDTTVEDLEKYSVVFYAHPVIMTEARAAVLKEYVEQGGTLIIGCRSGYKDITGKCPMMPQPGLLADLTGTDVYDWTFAVPGEEDATAVFGTRVLKMTVFNDIMKIREGEETGSGDGLTESRVLAVYADKYYAGSAAITEKKTGAGRTIHFGAAFDIDAVRALLEYTGIADPERGTIAVPESVELVTRKKDEKKYYFTINYTDAEQKLDLGSEMYNLLARDSASGDAAERYTGEYVLKPYEVAVWTR